MKGLFAGFQMAFKLMYYHMTEHPKNDKVVSDIYITCDMSLMTKWNILT